MKEAFMAFPELRHPFEASEIHPRGSTTVLYRGKSTTLAETGKGDGLLVRPDDLARANGFELKPEGACYQDTCIPLGDELLVERGGKEWFDLAAFADLLGQPYVADKQANVWSFAEIPLKRRGMMTEAMVPDFEVTDRQGKLITKNSLKGKKAMIVTWASW